MVFWRIVLIGVDDWYLLLKDLLHALASGACIERATNLDSQYFLL